MQSLPRRMGLVLGASTGIGAATLKTLQSAGASVVGLSRNRPVGESEDWISADVTDYDAMRSAISSLVQEREVDFIVDCVAVSYYSPLRGDYTSAWTDMVRTNIVGLLVVLSLTIELATRLRDFVHIGSVASRQMSSVVGNECYSVTKAAQQQLVEHLRRVSGGRMRVSSISPGFTRHTAFVERFASRTPGDVAVTLDENNSLAAEDVAECVKVLLSAPMHVEWSDVVLTPVHLKHQPS